MNYLFLTFKFFVAFLFFVGFVLGLATICAYVHTNFGFWWAALGPLPLGISFWISGLVHFGPKYLDWLSE